MNERAVIFNRVESGKPRKKYIPRPSEFYEGSGLLLTEAWPRERVKMVIDLWSANLGERIIAKKTGASLSAARAKIANLVKHGLIFRRGNHGRKPNGSSLSTAFIVKYDEERAKKFTEVGLTILERFESKMTNDGVGIMSLGRFSCRMTTGVDLFCGRTVEKGSYCAECRKRVYTVAA